jgi:cytochrome P450
VTAPPAARQAPGPSPLALLLLVAGSRRNTLNILRAAWQRYGDLVRLAQPGAQPTYLLLHPDYVKQVLQERPHDYLKAPVYQEMTAVLGNSLLTTDGEAWRRRRRLLQGAFQPKSLALLATATVDLAAEMLDRWEQQASRHQPVDILREMMWLSLGAVARSLFGTDLGGQSDEIQRAVLEMQQHTNRRLKGYPDVPEWVPLPSHRRFTRARSALAALADRLLAEHQANRPAQDDLISLLLETEGESRGLTRAELRSELLTTLLAGYETTYTALVWTWLLLARNPASQSRLQVEVAGVLGGRRPTTQDLARLVYTRWVFQEALRLYPPAWAFSRLVPQQDQIGGYDIPAGSRLMFIPFFTHRHPAFWDEPERFDPERFSPRRAADRAHYAYFPFGGGPRTCIGSHFAMVEAQLALAMVAQRYTLRLVPGCRIGLRPMVTLQPNRAPLMYLEPISASFDAAIWQEPAEVSAGPTVAGTAPG